MAGNVMVNNAPSPARGEETRSYRHVVAPAVDIVEYEEGLMLVADLPGAGKESLEVSVDQGVLTIAAEAPEAMPGRTLFTEFELARYRRQFRISDELDHAKARADFVNGVLTLRIPVAEAAKPRKIEVKVS
ncbi:Hsp20/alpha crystallin family protein [Geomesophilobacter sediminis]|uniref:Hsp20/alpha crystallin family protein n=1 Tax=Geomesophilobacter sediminis TaxID=2798584 RepID=A0A8J7IMT1_9BACT|nr:Hsp20/alpha crystallin family protein [Geomesophilobacter sediminis]MBJ6723124.1 Hsp20/alpha crystallin family protein [Geomesophilobacter sediminis]